MLNYSANPIYKSIKYALRDTPDENSQSKND